MRIVELTTNGRRNLTADSLCAARIEHEVFLNPHRILPDTIRDHPRNFPHMNVAGAYRCWMGHRSIWESVTTNTLVTEDDASPVHSRTWSNAEKAECLLKASPIVS